MLALPESNEELNYFRRKRSEYFSLSKQAADGDYGTRGHIGRLLSYTIKDIIYAVGLYFHNARLSGRRHFCISGWLRTRTFFEKESGFGGLFQAQIDPDIAAVLCHHDPYPDNIGDRNVAGGGV